MTEWLLTLLLPNRPFHNLEIGTSNKQWCSELLRIMRIMETLLQQDTVTGSSKSSTVVRPPSAVSNIVSDTPSDDFPSHSRLNSTCTTTGKRKKWWGKGKRRCKETCIHDFFCLCSHDYIPNAKNHLEHLDARLG